MQCIHSRRFREIFGGMLLVAVLVLPVLTFASGTKKIYVDDNASGTQDGTSNHPYKTLSQAIAKINGKAEIIVAKGKYKENITLPKNVTLTGAGRDKVTIDAKDSGDPVVVMNHKTKLRGVTVRDGKVGVVVKSDSRAEISDCSIVSNGREGVVVKEADRDNDRKMSIVNTDVKDNGRAGVYSEKRKLVIIDSSIKENHGDGVNLAKGVHAYLDNNSLSKNGGSGLSFALDRSSVYVDSGNSFRDNDHEGVEINAYGENGSAMFKKSRFVGNDRYAIAKLDRGAHAKVWAGVVVEKTNTYLENTKGEVSPVIRVR